MANLSETGKPQDIGQAPVSPLLALLDAARAEADEREHFRALLASGWRPVGFPGLRIAGRPVPPGAPGPETGRRQ